MKGNILEEVSCNLCGSDSFKVIYPSQYDKVSQQELADKFRSSGDELLVDQLVECKNCGLRFVNPRIKAEFILKGYSEGTDEGFVSQADSRERTFNRQLKLIEKYARKGKVCDIGTAGGSFLQAARKRGWEVYGSEPNLWLCKWAKKHYGLEVQQGDVFSQKYDDGFFDLVTLWDVLEHVPDPAKTLREINRILKNGGVLVVNYPDIGSWISKFMGKRWVFLLSVHLYYFSRKTIRRMLVDTGFDIIRIKPHIQTLRLGYLVFRMKAYSKMLYYVSMPFLRILRLQNLQIPYWLGQTLVMARKKQ